jgi:hypothetical protein
MNKKYIGKTILITLILLFTVGTIHQVLAANAENVFGGKVILLKKIPPTYFNTKNGFVSFLRKNKITTLYANKDNEWDFKSMAFFRKSLGDYEVEMVFYDVTGGKSKSARIFKDSFTQYTQDRESRSLLGRAVLTRPRFDANRKYIVEVQSHGKTVATGSFSTKGISQAQLDEQKRIDNEMKQMQKSMEELKRKAAEQEKQQAAEEKNKDAAAGDDLF